MKALIFAAGLGTRLQPLTDNKPKALVEISGKPLLYYAIHKLKQAGFTSIIINVHHFAQLIIDYLNDNDNFGLDIEISDESDLLLNTGGGLKKAEWFLKGKDPFIIYNVDIVTDINLLELLDFHKSSGAIITLAVLQRETARYFLCDENNTVCGWRNTKENCEKIVREYNHLKQLAFSGIQIVNPTIFTLITKEGHFPIVEEYLEIAKTNIIKAFDHTGSLWCDTGKLSEIKKAEAIVKTLGL